MATDVTLTKIQKNRILILIQHNGFDPTDFLLTEVESDEYYATSSFEYTASQLRHRSTGYYFTFGSYSLFFSPGFQRKSETKQHNDSWETKEFQLGQWLKRIKAEVETPDLWAAIGEGRVLSDAASSSLENRPFTPGEQSTIKAALEELRQYLVINPVARDDHSKFVEQQLRYLDESSKRLGRKDWVNILFSTLISLALTLALPPERANGLLRLAGTLLHQLWDGMQRLVQ